MKEYGPPQGGLNVHATPLEQKLLLRFLAMNGKVLSPACTPEKDIIEQNFRTSFPLPLGPLSYQDIGKLNDDPGCVLCGQKPLVQCRQCISVLRCGCVAGRAYIAPRATRRPAVLSNRLPAHGLAGSQGRLPLAQRRDVAHY